MSKSSHVRSCRIIAHLRGALLSALAVSIYCVPLAAAAKGAPVHLASPSIGGVPSCTFVNVSNADIADVTLRLVEPEEAYVAAEKTVDVPSGKGTSLFTASDVGHYCTVDYIGKANDARATLCILDPDTLDYYSCVPVY